MQKIKSGLRGELVELALDQRDMVTQVRVDRIAPGRNRNRIQPFPQMFRVTSVLGEYPSAWEFPGIF